MYSIRTAPSDNHKRSTTAPLFRNKLIRAALNGQPETGLEACNLNTSRDAGVPFTNECNRLNPAGLPRVSGQPKHE